MAVWAWALERADGTNMGTSGGFDSRGDAESWIGLEFEALLDRGIDRVTLTLDGEPAAEAMDLGPADQ